MTQYAIVTDLNRCVGCLACNVACKVVNGTDLGEYWCKTVRVGPTPTPGGSGQFPDIQMYFLTLQCQHCQNPSCVDVCPTGASQKMDDGTIQIDQDACIGCGSCVEACPYGARSLNVETHVAEKCTLCAERLEQGELPQCVAQCGGRARFFGDLEEGIESFVAPGTLEAGLGADRKRVNPIGYDEQVATRVTLGEYVEPFEESDVYRIDDLGTGPNMVCILRGKEWQGYSEKL